jgi:putative transcriptional regulator
MASKKNTDRMMAGLEEVLAIVEGRAEPARVFVPNRVDVRAIRERLKLSQNAFAAQFGFSAATVRQWEQNRRQPDGPARVLLTVIAREPEAVQRALAAA